MSRMTLNRQQTINGILIEEYVIYRVVKVNGKISSNSFEKECSNALHKENEKIFKKK